MKIITFSQIQYDTDGEVVEGLPTVITTNSNEIGYSEYDDGDLEWYVAEYGADYISDHTGWLVNGFNFEIEN